MDSMAFLVLNKGPAHALNVVFTFCYQLIKTSKEQTVPISHYYAEGYEFLIKSSTILHYSLHFEIGRLRAESCTMHTYTCTFSTFF